MASTAELIAAQEAAIARSRARVAELKKKARDEARALMAAEQAAFAKAFMAAMQATTPKAVRHVADRVLDAAVISSLRSHLGIDARPEQATQPQGIDAEAGCETVDHPADRWPS